MEKQQQKEKLLLFVVNEKVFVNTSWKISSFFSLITYWPREVCRRRVTRVEAPGHVQLFANKAYLNSSSHTTYSANFTCNLFSGLKICTYCATFGAKSFTAQDLSIVCSS